MQLTRRLFAKVSSVLHFTRLLRVAGAKKISFKQHLFSDTYGKRKIDYQELADKHFVVDSNEATLFGERGGLAHFILDWLKEAYLRNNRAYLRFLAIFDNTLVHQSLQIKSFSSLIFRTETTTTAQQQRQLLQSYFSSLTEHYGELSMLPATLITRAEHYSLSNLQRLLRHYFPHAIHLTMSDIEVKSIPSHARSQLGSCQLGRGAVLGAQFAQLGRTLTVTVMYEDAAIFSKLEQQEAQQVELLSAIKSLCSHYVSHEVVVEVEAQYIGTVPSDLVLTHHQKGIVLGVNANVTRRNGNQKRTVRAL
ncbi:type VI secretion system baseplate subunit TssG [Pseudoalteromonas sp. McH1-7]|uniref:type VI secretion system baseplate subunit TssG n=1 Tax=Pseudoalteromonas TaxID=53246 RepID=UPI00158FE2FC|nr:MULTISPECIES: type VI secretion system baseplate subunit TssG [Pseudoalteromonas]MDW7551243.1 type VI secretion system baseplate subunit TssG [Pseudoalteromonas peptidolytica]NUZ12294.1 type VI secretion system baseplate subunit TssG [Pseudoalteromonas sp. McH1-7]USD28427.1 type VI secretion system baseplate subunit TssG [Pseudoalteromonas sp. SCSIO 43201]